MRRRAGIDFRALGAGTEAATTGRQGRQRMNPILVIILLVLLIGALPTWPYSAGWGFYPSGTVGIVLLLIIILALTGRM